MATLTRDEMKSIIERGETVIHNGRFLSHVDHLPSEADLAKGDPAKEKAAAEAIDEQIAALQAAKANLGKAKPAPKVVEPAHADPVVPASVASGPPPVLEPVKVLTPAPVKAPELKK